MKPFLSLVIIGSLICICGCATSLKFSDENASYKVIWSEGQVSRIECWSDKIPDGFLLVDISRTHQSKTVFIKSKDNEVYGKEQFVRGADIGSYSGIIFYEESSLVNSDRVEIKEWRLEKNQLLIYKEIQINDENGALKRRQFFGPFGLELKAPSHPSIN